MTIKVDIETEINVSVAAGFDLSALTLRLGPGALYALAATMPDPDRPRDWRPKRVLGVRVELVGAPPVGVPSHDALFHGWELLP